MESDTIALLHIFVRSSIFVGINIKASIIEHVQLITVKVKNDALSIYRIETLLISLSRGTILKKAL